MSSDKKPMEIIKIKPKYRIGSNSHNFWKPYKFYENNENLIHKVSEIYKEEPI